MTDEYTLYHLPCRAPCEFIGDPNHPPDPDRHGNRRHPYRCTCCGERTTVTQKKHGGEITERGFSRARDIEWLVPIEG